MDEPLAIGGKIVPIGSLSRCKTADPPGGSSPYLLLLTVPLCRYGMGVGVFI